MPPATTKGVRRMILKAIVSNAEMCVTAAPPEIESFAKATLDLTSAYMNIHVIAPEDA